MLRPLLLCSFLMWAGNASAQTTYTPTNADGRIEIVIKDHKFEPAEIRVPVGQRIELLVDNQDSTAEEFESNELKVEKVIAGGAQGIIRLRALDAGEYPFVGEFNEETAQGILIVE